MFAWLTHDRVMRWGMTLLVVTTTFGLAACSGSTNASTAPTATATPPTAATVLPPAPRRLASDPAQLADELVADERALRDAATPEAALSTAARRQQAAYRAIGASPRLGRVRSPTNPGRAPRGLRPQRRCPPESWARYPPQGHRAGVERRRPGPRRGTVRDYRDAESASGVGWNYLAAINLIETRFGSIEGASEAGARGPMQFLPSTFAAHGDGGDIDSPRDSIMAAGRYLAANGSGADRDHAIYRYNNADTYVRAVNDYAAILANDPSTFAGYYRWDVYYSTTAGDVLLPIGYTATSPIPVGDYLATHPQ